MKRLLRACGLAILGLALGAFVDLPVLAQGVVTPRASGSGGTVGSGSTLNPPCTSSILYADASSLLKCDPAAVVNGSVSTAGRSILTIQDTISGSSATSNFLNITGTVPGTLSAETNAILFNPTFASQGQMQNGIKVLIGASGGNTTAYSAGVSIINAQIGASGLATFLGAPGTANVMHGVYAECASVTCVGVHGHAATNGSSQNSVGVIGEATNTNATAGTWRIGVWGNAPSGPANPVGGYFTLGSLGTIPGGIGAAALVADNLTIAANIFEARDNGTPVFTIADGGSVIHTGAFNSNGGGIYAYSGAGFGFAINGGATTTPLIRIETGLTPDALSFDTDTTSNSIHVSERADIGFDYQNPCTTGLGTSACTDPALIVHSHNQDTGEFLSMAHDGKAGVIVGGNSTVLDGTIRLGGTVTLTESSATAVLTVPVAVSTGTGGEIIYTVEARDATNTQIRAGKVLYAVANNSGGTETCNVFGISTTQAVGGDTTNAANPTQVQDGSGVGAITSGTLTYAWSVDTTGSNQCVLKLNAVSSLTQTTLQVHYTVIQSGPGVSTGGD